jgi:hypothetical protein
MRGNDGRGSMGSVCPQPALSMPAISITHTSDVNHRSKSLSLPYTSHLWRKYKSQHTAHHAAHQQARQEVVTLSPAHATSQALYNGWQFNGTHKHPVAL